MRLIVFVSLLIGINLNSTIAQDAAKPFIMPVAAPAGPGTWLFGQPYGNTVGAYNFGTAWYSAGQGLHFGIDVSMPCGTPLVAVADGEVIYADNLSFGAGPHNLILRHADAGVTTLYGHLFDVPPVQQYQPVRQGDIVGYSGDPDVTCDSRPHLHFEVRSLDYRTAYNPIDYIDVHWDILAALGSFNQTMFQMDLTNTRQWMRLNDQPPIAFGGARLNSYTFTWPSANSERPPSNPPLPREVVSLSEDISWQLTPIGYSGCCLAFWWHPADANRLFAIDGTVGQIANIIEWNMSSGGPTSLFGQAPPPMLSPDGTHQIVAANGQVSIRRLADNAEWVVQTQGAVPAVSTDNSRLLWLVSNGQDVPGARDPFVQVWMSALDGQNARQIVGEEGISARWLDGSRLLLSTSERTLTTLTIYNTVDDTSFELGTWDRMRGTTIAPGGNRLMFYRSFQANPDENGVYVIDVQPGAQPQKLPWFGGWRWRDADSVYYIPFDPANNVQKLAYFHVPSGESRLLTDPTTTPFTIANGDWSVSADGQQIVFLNAADNTLWLLAAG
jgi:hypothetical protein